MTFDEFRARTLRANAALAAAERECLAASLQEAVAVGDRAGMGPGLLMVFHAVPRGGRVIELDLADCSPHDAALEALDLADHLGRRVRLTRAGLTELPDGPVGAPALSRQVLATCGLPGAGCESGDLAERAAPPVVRPLLGGDLWQLAVLTWVDLHHALAGWTGHWLSSSLVVAPGVGDAASVQPSFCPDSGADFEVVTSLRLGSAELPADDLAAALQGMLEGDPSVTPDSVEVDLTRRLAEACLELPGWPAHPPGECLFAPGACQIGGDDAF